MTAARSTVLQPCQALTRAGKPCKRPATWEAPYTPGEFCRGHAETTARTRRATQIYSRRRGRIREVKPLAAPRRGPLPEQIPATVEAVIPALAQARDGADLHVCRMAIITGRLYHDHTVMDALAAARTRVTTALHADIENARQRTYERTGRH